MKTIAIGDIHGRDSWQEIVDGETDAGGIIFAGDYFDAKEPGINLARQIDNFVGLTKFKRENKTRITLLLGDHDFHYLPVTDQTYSGYQSAGIVAIGPMLEEAIRDDLVQFAKEIDGVLYTHAGVTKTWRTNNGIAPNCTNLADEINNVYKKSPRAFEFQGVEDRSRDPSGDNIDQGPIWVRPKSLILDGVEKKQVVGHTMQDEIELIQGGTLALIDTLGTSGEYLVVEDGKMIASKL